VSAVPESSRYVVIGAGIHGLSTAWQLATELRARGAGSGEEVVTVWDSDPEAFHYHPVGYMQIAPEVMHADVATIYEQQQAIGYESSFIEGADDCRLYMQGIFHDWQAKNITAVLHEKKGGYAENMPSMRGLAGKAEAAGARILSPITVTGFATDGAGAVTAVETDQGAIRCEQVIVAAGPWVRDVWALLGLPATTTVRGRDGNDHERPMWTYWCLQEGTLGVDPSFLTDNAGNMPPVIHVDTDAALVDDADGSLVTEELWGIYYKPDFNFGGVQGGAMPWEVHQPAGDVAVDPYGPKSKEYVVTPEFERMWTAALAHCQKRFEGKRPLYHKAPTGGIGAFTPDSFPVFDVFHENAYVVADSNHGYKMIGVGALVAKELLGEPQALLEPFRFSRYAAGQLHPVSHSPFPWS
jgi:glycine/D-amino acid oxidase-like deaminating enzyme